MGKMSDREWEDLQSFETTWLLSAVEHVDKLRQHLGDGENFQPPEIRADLLKLHQLTMGVVNSGWESRAGKMFELAHELDMQVAEIAESLEFIQRTLTALTDLFPESLADEID